MVLKRSTTRSFLQAYYYISTVYILCFFLLLLTTFSPSLFGTNKKKNANIFFVVEATSWKEKWLGIGELKNDNNTISSTSSTQSTTTNNNITVIGLGGMGTSVAKCLAKTGATGAGGGAGKDMKKTKKVESSTTNVNVVVHVWNRGEMKRQALKEEGIPSIVVHDTAQDAIHSSPLIVIVIDDWENGVVSIIQRHQDILSSSSSSNGNKTVVIFSTYSPIDIQKLASAESTNNTIDFVGGAIIGVPETICTPLSLIMLDRPVLELRPLSKNILSFSFSTSDDKDLLGMASLMNLCLLLPIFFGLVGYELSHLIIQQYFQKFNNTVTSQIIEFERIFHELTKGVSIKYTQMLLEPTSQAITNNNYNNMYAPTIAIIKLFQLVLDLGTLIGIDMTNTFLDAHVKTLERRVQNPNVQGPAAWIKGMVSVESNSDVREEEAVGGGVRAEEL